MPRADASSADLAYAEETTAYAQAETGNYTRFRFTGETLKQDTTTVISEEIRNDRQVADIIRTGLSASGDVSVEMSYGAHDDLFEAGLLSADWIAEVSIDAADTTISASTTDDSFNHATGWANNATPAAWILVSGFTNPENNGYFKVASGSTSTKIIVEDANLVTEAAGNAITIRQGSYIQNGSEFRSFTVEKQWTDLTNKYQRLLGMVVDGFNMEIETEAILKGGFTFLGKSMTSESSASGTFVDNAANEVMNSVDDVFAVLEGDAASSLTILGASINIANNMRTRLAVGALGAIDIGKGTLNISGSLRTYLEDETEIDKYLNFTESSLTFILEDGTGKAYVIEIPGVKYTDGNVVAAGQNQDVEVELEYSAKINTADNRMIQMVRFA